MKKSRWSYFFLVRECCICVAGWRVRVPPAAGPSQPVPLLPLQQHAHTLRRDRYTQPRDERRGTRIPWAHQHIPRLPCLR